MISTWLLRTRIILWLPQQQLETPEQNMQGKGDLMEDIMISRPGDIVQRPTFDHSSNLMFWIGFIDHSLFMRQRYRPENSFKKFIWKYKGYLKERLVQMTFESWDQKMGAGSLFFWYFPPKKPFFALFMFLGLSQIIRVFSPKSGFSSKKGLFSPAGERLLYYEQREPSSRAKGMQCP